MGARKRAWRDSERQGAEGTHGITRAVRRRNRRHRPRSSCRARARPPARERPGSAFGSKSAPLRAPPSPARLLRLRSCGPGSGVRACGAAAPQIAAQRLLAPRRDPPYSAPLRWLPGSAFGSNSGGESGRRGGSASPASASAAGRRGGEGRAHCSSRAARSSRLLPGRLLRCRASQAAPARAPLPLHSVRLQRLRDQIGDRDVAPAPASATERKRPGPGLNNAGPGPGRSPAVCRANA